MKSDDPDVISFGRAGTGSNRISWAVAGLLSACLAIAIISAVHYHGQVVALHRQVRNTARVTVFPTNSAATTPTSGLTVSRANAALLPAGSLTGKVTFVAAHLDSGLRTSVVIIAYVSGGRPHTRYTLTGGSCSGRSRHRWASGITDAAGNGELVGPVWRISQAATYWLELSPAARNLHPSLAGDFASGAVTAYKSGPPMCGA